MLRIILTFSTIIPSNLKIVTQTPLDSLSNPQVTMQEVIWWIIAFQTIIFIQEKIRVTLLINTGICCKEKETYNNNNRLAFWLRIYTLINKAIIIEIFRIEWHQLIIKSVRHTMNFQIQKILQVLLLHHPKTQLQILIGYQ